MNKLCHKNPYKIFHILLVFAFTVLYTSCVYDDDGDNDCPTGFHIRFKYDYNMKYADAFNNEVDRVTVYVFDEEGKYIMQKTEEGTALKDKNYYMTLDLILGNYTLLTWAGLNGTSFNLVRELVAGQSELTDMQVLLNMSGMVSNSDLHPLWHGQETRLEVTNNGYRETLIPLVKDTKRIRMVLQQVNGLPMTEDDFRFEIIDDNSLLNYDNSIIPNGIVTYNPYVSGAITIGDIQPVTAVYYEAGTNRLMADSQARLRITRAEDESVIVDIPLISYLLLTELEGHKEKMTTQEYLDRQDEYSLVFFLDENMSWYDLEIIVNGWTIRFNQGQLE